MVRSTKVSRLLHRLTWWTWAVAWSLVCATSWAQTSALEGRVLKEGPPGAKDVIVQISSAVLGHERSLQIYLPPNYTTSPDRRYPVLFVLDSQEYLLHPIAYQEMLRFRDKAPDFLVVGLATDRRRRRELFGRDARKFIKFLSQELIPTIDRSYRTLGARERLLFGWEMAGGLGLQAYTQHPDLFSAILIASPTHLTEDRLSGFAQTLAAKPSPSTYFYVANAASRDDAFIDERLASLRGIFEKAPAGTSVFDVVKLPGEDHYSTPAKVIHNGLRVYFRDYNPIRFLSLKDYEEFGGIEVLKAYYEHRGKRYGVSTEIQRESKHFLLLSSMNEDNYPTFIFFDQTFSDFLNSQQSRDFWVQRFADYHLQNRNSDRAMEIYKVNLAKFPDSAVIYHGIGNIHLIKGDEAEARKAFSKAVELARESSDPDLAKYEDRLREVAHEG